MKRVGYIIRIFFTAIFVSVTVSCVKDDIFDPDKDGTGEIPGEPKGPYFFSISAGRGHITGENPRTRAELDISNYNYYWNSSEQVKLTVTNQGTNTVLADLKNVMLTKIGTDNRVSHANFRGDINLTQFDALSSAPTFDYYSYYSNGISVTDTDFPNTISFPLGQATYSSLAPNDFTAAKTPMVGIVEDREPNIIFLENHVVTHTDNPIHFDYDHTTSYAAIEFDVRLLPGVKVTSLTMTVGSDSNGWIRGTYTYDVTNKTGSLSAGDNSVTINIPGGMNIGNGEKLYIPMPVKEFENQMFTFVYTTSGGTSGNSYGTTTVSGVKTINFERGKIHTIRVAPPIARYTVNENFTITQDGYYYIEAWGGDGGIGGKGDEQNSNQITFATSQKTSGLYYLVKGTEISLYIGSAGGSKGTGASAGSGSGGSGGTNGFAYGAGGTGGAGRKHSSLSNWAGAGGGGGAGTFVLAGAAAYPANVLLVSGGAGGNGGGGGNSTGANSSGGTGGGGGGGNGSSGSAGNSGARGAGATTFNNNPAGNNGSNSSSGNAPGGGGGGGGGGYQYGGNGGSGGGTGSGLIGYCGGGGGGKGGGSYGANTSVPPSGKPLPSGNTRPAGPYDSNRGISGPANGYVIITYFRP